MAVIPMLLNIAEELENSLYGYDKFGWGINPREMRRLSCRSSPHLRVVPGTYRKRTCPYSLQKCDKAKKSLNITKDGFQMSVDVQQFKPEEITVKTVDNSVVIEGKHEEREDEHGIISRQFVRRFTIPEGYDPKDVISTLSSDGVLTVKAPLPQKQKTPEERIVQIQQTGSSCDSIENRNSFDKHKDVSLNGATNDENSMDQ